jgi:hypothetical protein|tara:strand:+ start:654 stop:1028 length:375 start_codon:yes stop_codon:yes gene_type:complete
MLPIQIQVGDLRLIGELNELKCARALACLLPLTAKFQVWGDELHFKAMLGDDTSAHPGKSVSIGDIGFWSEGSTLCIFFGPTPTSSGEDPVSAVPVTIVGRVNSFEKLRTCKEAGEIILRAREV